MSDVKVDPEMLNHIVSNAEPETEFEFIESILDLAQSMFGCTCSSAERETGHLPTCELHQGDSDERA